MVWRKPFFCNQGSWCTSWFEGLFCLIWWLAMVIGGSIWWGDQLAFQGTLGKTVLVNSGSISFHIGEAETTVSQYCHFLNSRAEWVETAHPQCRRRQGRFVPKRGLARRPVTHVRFSDAENYCLWLSEITEQYVRLPSEEEWMVAASGGDARFKYPWGWGDPTPHARFARRFAANVRCYEPNAFGLYDMAGNVFEWCDDASGVGDQDKHVVRGGSWAETSTEMLAISNRVLLPQDYRDADVGFRVVLERKR